MDTLVQAPGQRGQSLTSAIISLHLRLWKNNIKSNKAQIFLILMVWLYSVPVAVGFAAANIFRDSGVMLATPLATGVLAYWLLCLFYPTSESQLTPSWFAVLPVTAHQLVPGFLATTLLQSRGVLVVVNSVITAVAASIAVIHDGHPVAVAGVIAAVIVAGLLSLMGGEAIASVGVGFASNRSRKEKYSALAGIGIAVVIVLFNLVANTFKLIPEGLVTKVLSYTPMGAGGGAVESAIAGHWVAAIVQTVLAIVILPIAWWVWRHNLGVALTHVTDTSSQVITSTRHSVLLPGVGTSTIALLASRFVVYMRRDSRQFISLVTMPIFVILFTVLGLTTDQPGYRWMGLFFGVVFNAQLLSNTIGMDGPSNWVHMVIPVDAKDLLRSRVLVSTPLGLLVMAIPATAVGIVDGVNVTWLVYMVGALAGLCASIGLGVFAAVTYPYPMARPGTNPYKDKSSYSSSAWITALLTLVVVWLPLLPGVVVVAVGFVKYGATVNALVIGGTALMLVSGVVVGAVLYALSLAKLRRSWPEIFGKVNRYV